MTPLERCLYAAVACTLSVWACAGHPTPRLTEQRPAPPVPDSPPVSSSAQPAAPKPPPVELPLGVIDVPPDETAFDYEVELPHASDEPALLDGIPPADPSIKRTLAPYLETRRARLAGVSGSGELLVLTRLGETTHAHRVSQPLGQREQVTFGVEPVQQATFVPGRSHLVTYRADASGNENYQVFLVDLLTRQLRLLSDGNSRHGPFRWSAQGRSVVFTQLDGDADANFLVGSLQQRDLRTLAKKQGQWVALAWSRDESEILVQEHAANTETRLHIMNAATGDTEPLGNLDDEVTYQQATFSDRGASILTLSNREGTFVQLWRYVRQNRSWRRLTQHRWNVEEFAQTSDGQSLAYVVNEDGVSRLYVMDPATGASRAVPKVPAGVVSGLRFQTRDALAFSLSTATSPMDVFSYDLRRDHLTRWTKSETGGISESAFVPARLIRFPSFDGRKIPALLYQAPGVGPFPVLIWIHGGPEGQSRPSFDPIIQYFAGRMGIAVLAPNIRGSDGYGKHYLSLDDGLRRYDSIRDIGQLLTWIEKQPQLDEKRVGIHGASYGGFVTLASMVEYSEKLAAGSDMVGISNLVSFLENTSSYRRTLRRREYGDERDPEARDFLEAISPLSNAERIKSPLFVAHGANDPRVPLREAEAIVERVRAAGQPVWYMLARSEGHSFRRRSNRDQYYQLLATFFAQHLLNGSFHVSAKTTAPSDSAGAIGN